MTTSRSAKVLVKALNLYQGARAGKPSPCRYHPSCSSYAIEAIEIHGAIRGAGLATWRVLRCQPFASYGYDPVPAPKSRSLKAS